MKTVIYVALEVVMAMKPRACANEDTACKPFRTVVAVRSTVIRRGVIVAVGTIGCNSNLHSNLSRCFRSGCHHKTSSNSRQYNKPESGHKPSSLLWGRHQAPPGYSP